jgi:hypothetical protein
MKVVIRQKENVEKDDTLFGLLSQHKVFVTYLRILINEKEKRVSFQMTDNPAKWRALPPGRYDGFRMLTRNEIGVTRLSVKYLTPRQVLSHVTPTLGMKLSSRSTEIIDTLGDQGSGYFCLDCGVKHLEGMVLTARKILNLAPQKKFAIIETYLATTGAATVS